MGPVLHRREGDMGCVGCVQVTMGQNSGWRWEARRRELDRGEQMLARKRGLDFECKLMAIGFSAFLHPMYYGRQICLLTKT